MTFILTRKDKLGVITIVAVYALFGGLWIYLSDTALGLLVRDPEIMTRIATYKGLLFIAATATLLYYLIGRYVSRLSESSRLINASEQRFQTIFNNISDAVFVHDAATGRFIDVNRTACEMFGYNHDELLALDVNAISLGDPPFSQEEALAWLQIAAQGTPQTFEWHCRHSDGSLFWTDVNMRAASIAGEARIVVSVRDISLRKFTENAIKESEESLRLLMDLMPVGIVCADGTGTTEYINRNFTEKFGYQLPEIPTSDVWFLKAHPEPGYREEIASLWNADLAEYHTHGTPVPPRDVEVTCKNGTRRHVIINCQILQNRTIAIFTDITERENRQEELIKNQKLESIGLLAGGIAHDFNNILTGILGYISYAAMFIEKEHRSCKPLLEAEKAAKRAAELAHQLLTFAKGGEPVTRTISMRPLLEESVSLVLSGSNVSAVVEVPEQLFAIEADAGQLSQVFNNLVINAVQAMPGGGTITITATNMVVDGNNSMSLPPGKYVRATFADHGCGIPAENLKKVFDPYFTTKSGGSGIGLASVYSIIKKHRGHIDVSSERGCGTTFEILLPASEKKAVVGPTPHSEATVAAGDSLTVLVMDDEEMIRDLTTAMLEESAYRVTTCSNGAEAIELYRTAFTAGVPFAAAILDLTIPKGMGGKEAASKILDTDPLARLIVSSGYSTDPVMANYHEFGFCGAAIKPYSFAEITVVLNDVLNNRERIKQ